MSESAMTQRESPPKPGPFLWQCHVCRRIYQLGVTRRCLDCGHYFCRALTGDDENQVAGGATKYYAEVDGRPVLVTPKKKKRHTCYNEFDFAGWRTYRAWATRNRPPSESTIGDWGHEGRNCWEECDYPGQCRWGARRSDGSSDGYEASGEDDDDEEGEEEDGGEARGDGGEYTAEEEAEGEDEGAEEENDEEYGDGNGKDDGDVHHDNDANEDSDDGHVSLNGFDSENKAGPSRELVEEITVTKAENAKRRRGRWSNILPFSLV